MLNLAIELVSGLGIAVLMMLVMWFYYLGTKNPGVVDVGWGIGIMACGLWFMWPGDFSLYFYTLNILLLIWGIRLSGFLWFTRIRPAHIEKRYLNIAKNWQVKQSIGFLANFMLQAFLLTIVAIPFFFVAKEKTIGLIEITGFSLIILGVIGETVADLQLYSFRKSTPGQVCNVGLWHYSRHPNYFFEILVWLGFSISVYSGPVSLFAFVSPINLIIIMRFITGPITERVSLQSKGDAYKAYQKTTSMIIPWFNKKGT